MATQSDGFFGDLKSYVVPPLATTFSQSQSAAPADPSVEGATDDRDRWDAILHDRLLSWQQDPALVADEEEGQTAPSPAAFEAAIRLAKLLRDEGYSPARTAPDGEGGLSFEWSLPSGLLKINVHPEGVAELMLFENHKLVAQRVLNKP